MQKSLDTLKQKLVTTSILIFPYWKKEFHVHVDASSVALGIILAQPREGDLDHPIAFSSRKLSTTEQNYTTTEREGLAMVYALQKFRHYLLGSHFKMYTDHFALRYLVNKPVLGGKICRWLLLFQEYDFEVIVKPGKLNSGLIICCAYYQEKMQEIWMTVYQMHTYLQYRWLMTILQI
jgi:hypothetical protein